MTTIIHLTEIHGNRIGISNRGEAFESRAGSQVVVNDVG